MKNIKNTLIFTAVLALCLQLQPFNCHAQPGSLDNSFSSDGKLTTAFESNDFGKATAIQSDGKIVVVGSSNGEFALARYNSNGILDTTFGSDGKVTTADGSEGNSVAIQSDGKIILVGYVPVGAQYSDFFLARYNNNGSLDSSFDNDGKLTTAVGDSGNYGYSVLLQQDGKIVVAGSSYNGAKSDFALVRYNGCPVVTTITPDGATTFCQGDSVLLTAAPAAAYQWSNGATTQSITVSTSGNYSAILTDTSGCTAKSAITNVSVETLPPVATITESGTTTFCQGNNVTLSSDSASSYLWSTNATTQSIVVNQSGSYTLIVSNSCGSDTSSATTVTVHPLPLVSLSLNPDTICINSGSFALTGGLPDGGIYSGDGVSAGNFNPTTAGKGLHNIIYTYIDGNSCSNSDTVQLFVDLCTGIQNVSNNQPMFIYPNPAGGKFIISANLRMTNLEIYNIIGEKLYSEKILNSMSLILNLNQPNGMYFMQLKTDQGVINKKLIIND